MNKSFVWLTLVILFIGACQGVTFLSGEETASPPFETTSEEPAPSKPGTFPSDSDFAQFQEGLIEAQQSTLNDLSGASFYRIEFTVQDEIYTVDGVEEVTYTNRETVPLEVINFRLLPNVLSGEMKVATVKVNDQPVEPDFELQGSLMHIPLIESLKPGDSLDIEIEFSVSVPTTIESNYGILAYFDGVLTLAHAYPMIAVYDDEGWDTEIPSSQGDPTYADASFFVVTVKAPDDLVLVGAGREISREENGGRQIVTYAAGPARDFYIAASADYEVVSQTIGEVTFNSYTYTGMDDGAQLAIDVSAAAFEYFGKMYTPYPYTEFDIVATPTYALGIEYPGIIAIADRIYDLGGYSYDTPNTLMLESTTAHEAGHQWFYNLVGNDQLDEPWLDESLTQFVTMEYYGNQYGSSVAEGFARALRYRWSGVDFAEIPIGQPVEAYEGNAYSAIIYGRGAFFFEALRDEIGEEEFNAFMKDYVVSNSWGIGTGENMQELAEAHCKCDLGDLYEMWVDP